MESCGKGCGAGYSEGKVADSRHGQAKDASPSTSVRSYNASVADGWTREDNPVADGWIRKDTPVANGYPSGQRGCSWAEPSVGASTSANLQQASRAMLPVWYP